MMAGKIIVLVAILSVAAVLCLGLYTLWVGGETARTWSNKLMRIRILAQAVAVVIIMVVLYFSQHGEHGQEKLKRPQDAKRFSVRPRDQT